MLEEQLQAAIKQLVHLYETNIPMPTEVHKGNYFNEQS